MLSLIANLVAKSFFAKPKITKEVVTAGILAVTAFLFFSIGLAYGFSSLESYLIAEGLQDHEANLYISVGCIVMTLTLAFIALRKVKKEKDKKEDNFENIAKLAEAFMEGFNSDNQESVNIKNFTEEKIKKQRSQK